MLTRQYNCYSVDTGAFNTEEEQFLYNKLSKLRRRKNMLMYFYKKMLQNHSIVRGFTGNEESMAEINDAITQKYKAILKELDLNTQIKIAKDDYMKKLSENKETRTLNPGALTEWNVISLFESTLSRALGIQTNELTTKIIVIETYFYDVLEQNIYNGFYLNGKHYTYRFSSAGQIRVKKGVFIEDEAWEKVELQITNGLTINEVNKKGGCNATKFLAYSALPCSATEEWSDHVTPELEEMGLKPFDIDKVIVIPDWDNTISSEVDFIDDVTYEITRKVMDIPMTQNDGCGMILPRVSKKNMMFRCPWMKGLLAVFDFHQFILETGCTEEVTDIYGKTWNILEDDIEVILTKSVFKMAKYYDSWDEYKTKFKKYNCHAGICNLEPDVLPKSSINYQMLQTLINIDDKEIERIASQSNATLKQISSNKDTMLRILGATSYNENKNAYQEALSIYPELLTDEYSKTVIKATKKSLEKKFKAGHLEVSGKFTFVIPDLYAFCEHIFTGADKPLGLLNNGEVYCRVYENVEELDCLRSPHLYMEHCVRKNAINDWTKKWFTTDAVYISTWDPISKVVQADFDGDRLLVLPDKTLVEVAKRNVAEYGVVPLFYNMKKANAVEVTPQSIWKSLQAAFKTNSIGVYSNNATKIWNAVEWPDIDRNEKERYLNLVKYLCLETNFSIDSAKSSYMVTRPETIDIQMKEAIHGKVPHFFIYAKNRENHQVEPTNNSFINKLENKIIRTRLNFKATNLGKLNYHYLMNNEDVEIDQAIIDKYQEIGRKYHFRLNIKPEVSDKPLNLNIVVLNIMKEFMNVNPAYSFSDITDMLVKYLYHERKNVSKKDMFWNVFGWEVLKNLKNKVPKNSKQCVICGTRFVPNGNRQKYCPACAKKAYANHRAEWTKERRESQKQYIADVERREKELAQREAELEEKIRAFEAQCNELKQA